MTRLDRRRAMMGQNSVKTYDFTPLLFDTKIDGYDEEGVEQFNTDAYDLNAAEVNIIEVFNESKLKKKAVIFSILSTAKSINATHKGTIRLFQTIDGVENFSDHTESDTDIALTSGSTHRYAIIYNTTESCTLRDNELIASASVVGFSLKRASGEFTMKQQYYLYDKRNIAPKTFWGGAKGKVLKLPKNYNSIGSYICQKTLYGQVVFPDTFTTIGNGGLEGTPCDIGTLVIPKSVTFIGSGNFSYQIKKLYLKSPVRYLWQFVNGATIVDKEITIAATADADENGLRKGYKLDNDGTYFYYIDYNTSEKILLKANASATILKQEEGVTLNTGAFAGCENAEPQQERFVLPNNTASVFYKCRKLTSIVIPNSVTTIGSYALANTGIASIVIPNSVTTIGQSAFSGCSSLTSIDFEEGSALTTINASAFSSTGATSIEIPDSVTGVGNAAFSANKFEEIVFPSGIASIPQSLCRLSKSLKRVIFKGSVSSITGWNSGGAFEDCTALEYLEIKGTFPTLSSLLNRCTALTRLVLNVVEPPTAGVHDYFGDKNNYKASTVYVPEDSVSAYQSHDFWGKYTIKPITEAPQE